MVKTAVGRPTAKSQKPTKSTRVRLGELFRAESSVFYLIAGSTMALVVFGLIMVMDSSSVTSHLDGEGFTGLFLKQLLFAVLGIPLMLVMSRLPLTFWKKSGRKIFMVVAASQLLVFVPGLGVSRGGNTNWIHLFGFTVQPSELIKVMLAIFLGIAFPVSMARAGNTWRALAPLGATLIVGGLVIIGGDLGTVFIFILISFGGMLFAGMSVRNMLIPVAGGFAAVAVLAVFSSSRVARIVSFYTNACVTDEGDCWQPIHGAWAMARGGIFGVGFGNSRMKWSWLPAADNDYIFAIIGEELGLIGCVVMLGLFVVLAIALLRVIREATDPFIRITTGGILFWFVGQAFLNVAVVLNLIPVLGLPIPFVSSGGTSLLSSLAATGVVLSFARHNERTGMSR